MPAKLTRWFSLEVDGNPWRRGWYDVTYISETVDNSTDRRYWTGTSWEQDPNALGLCLFGRQDISGEYWRGQAWPAK